MATEPLAEQTGLQGPAAWETEAEREQLHGVGPWRLGMRRLRRNKTALAFGFLFILLVAACLAAPLYAEHVAHTTADREPPVRHDHRRRQAEERGRLGRRADRAAVAQGRREVLARRRPERPRHHGAAALRRPQLADDRRGRGADDDDPVGHPRRARGLLPRLERHGDPVGTRHPLVVPGRDPRCGVGSGAGSGRAANRSDQDRGGLARRADIHHRAGLHPVHGAPDARTGAVAAREGVRGGGARPGRWTAADHVQRGRAQPGLDRARLLHAADRERGPARGRPVVPGRRRTAARTRPGAR